MLPLVMAGVSAVSSIGGMIGNRKARKRKMEAIRKQREGLVKAHEFNVAGMMDKVDALGLNQTLTARDRMLQARREAGKTLAIGTAAGASGSTAEGVVTDAYGRASGDVGTIAANTASNKRATFRDIYAAKLTLNSQLQSLDMQTPQKANPWLSALGIGASAVGAYASFGGEFKLPKLGGTDGKDV